MNLDLSNLKEPGSSKRIQERIKIPAFELHSQEIETPYLFDLDLNIINTNGSFVLTGQITGVLSLICNRCLEKFEHEIQVEIEEELLKEELENLERVDLIGILQENILLNLPIKILCSKDCKGLCTICGQNLNEKECGCEREAIDPRLAILKDFYKKADQER